MRWLIMNNSAIPTPSRGPIPGLPANHTHLRLGAPRVLVVEDEMTVAMLDVHLNGKTVFPFAAELEAREIPFLFATAYGPRGIPEEFRGHLVLQKPFGPVELRRALMDLAGRPN